jgi:hypothetical protein
MRNVHLLPTDKPSRLVKFFTNKFHLCKEILPIQDEEQYQYLYITSDEEIKEGDWCFDINGKIFKHENHFPISIGQRKIILTTDPDLISEGVQPIDNEFLEWFVKNPSCEFVEVKKGFADGTVWGYNFLDYKIILPQEATFINN